MAIYPESQLNSKFYIGTSSDPEKRLINHNLGRQRWTKRYIPWELIFKINLSNKSTALKLERKLKNYKNPTYIKKLISENKIAQLASPDSSG